MTIDSLDAKKITTANLTTLADRGTAETEIKALDTAIQELADARATFGSQLNRLDHNLNNVTSQATNMAAALLKSKMLIWQKRCLK